MKALFDDGWMEVKDHTNLSIAQKNRIYNQQTKQWDVPSNHQMELQSLLPSLPAIGKSFKKSSKSYQNLLADGYPAHRTEKKKHPKRSNELSIISQSIQLPPGARSLTGRSLPVANKTKQQDRHTPHSIRITDFDQSHISQDLSKNFTLR